MLSIANVKSTEGTAHYFAKEDYYAKNDAEHQKLSSWYGKGAERLGLEGQINTTDFKEIINGNLPNGDRLGRINSDGKESMH